MSSQLRGAVGAALIAVLTGMPAAAGVCAVLCASELTAAHHHRHHSVSPTETGPTTTGRAVPMGHYHGVLAGDTAHAPQPEPAHTVAVVVVSDGSCCANMAPAVVAPIEVVRGDVSTSQTTGLNVLASGVVPHTSLQLLRSDSLSPTPPAPTHVPLVLRV